MFSMKMRRGLTLTELLVTIAILVIVTSVLAPVLTSSLEGREVREATRQISAYFQQAQARARELGRPVGVVIRRAPVAVALSTEQDFGFQLSLAEEPPPYRGQRDTARARVEVDPTTYRPNGYVDIRDPVDIKTFRSLVQVNDFIRFNFRGPKYRILEVGQSQKTGFNHRIHFDFDVRERLNPSAVFSSSNLVPFEVFRRPQSTTSTPVELPVGSAIVMNLSGVGMDFASSSALGNGTESSIVPTTGIAPRNNIGLTEFQRPMANEFPSQIVNSLGSATKDAESALADMPLTIMFSPDGGIERIYRVMPSIQAEQNAFLAFIPPKRPQDKVYLFVGKGGVNRVDNLADGTNLWVAIDPQTGSVTTAPNVLPVDFDVASATANIPTLLRFVASARQIAATGQSMGGG